MLVCLFCHKCSCCSHINSHNQVRGHRTGASHSGAEGYTLGKNKNKPKLVRVCIMAEASHMSAKNSNMKSEVSVRMCQDQIYWYILFKTRS